MDIDRAYELLDRCTYKTGYNHFSIRPEIVEQQVFGARMEIHAKVPDTHKPGSAPGDIVLHMGIPDLSMLDDEAFLEFVAQALKQFEIHESEEGFRVDGVIWKNPHLGKQLPIEGIRG